MKKKIMAVLLALAMVTQGAMPVFAQNEGAEIKSALNSVKTQL